MKWKKVCAGWLVLTLLTIMTMVPVYAADTSQSYTFTVTADSLEQTLGEESTLTVALSKDGGEASYRLYASTVVLRFDGELFQENGIETAEGVTASVSDLSGSWEGWKAVTLNVLVSDLEGAVWDNPSVMAKITLRSVGQGVSTVSLRNGIVSTPGGMDSYTVHTGEVTIKVSSDQDQPEPPAGPGTPSAPSGGGSGGAGPSAPSAPSGSPGGTAEPANPDVPPVPEQPTLPAEPGTVEPVNDPGAPAQEPVPDGPVFMDVAQDAWYAEAVRYVVGRGTFQGTGETEFSPQMTMTRAMFVTVLGRMAGADAEDDQPSSFADVPAGQWYTAFVRWASANGIVTGYDAERFGPDDPVTREQMAAILYRYAKFSEKEALAGDTEKLRSFLDADQVSSYAEEAMGWATARGLINGMGDGTLAPGKTATRAEVAQLIMNFDKIIG